MTLDQVSDTLRSTFIQNGTALFPINTAVKQIERKHKIERLTFKTSLLNRLDNYIIILFTEDAPMTDYASRMVSLKAEQARLAQRQSELAAQARAP